MAKLEDKELLIQIVDEVKRLPEDRQTALLQALRSEDKSFGFGDRMRADPDLHTVRLEAVADAYRIHPKTLFRLKEEGKLKAFRFGETFVVTLCELRRFIREQGHGVEERSAKRRGNK